MRAVPYYSQSHLLQSLRHINNTSSLSLFPNFRPSSLRMPRLCSFSNTRPDTHTKTKIVAEVETGNGNNSLPAPDPQQKLLQVVLVSPQIPGNAGCIARTCAASAVALHLVGPLGFKVDDTKLKRAGLDYWPYPPVFVYVVVRIHGSWAEFQNYFKQQEGDKRLLAFTKRGTAVHSDFSYRKGDYLIFGSETCGLPPDVLLGCKSETFGGGTIRIPMVETYVRCLNLSVSVGIAVYEASRQLNYEQLQVPSTNSGCRQKRRIFLEGDQAKYWWGKSNAGGDACHPMEPSVCLHKRSNSVVICGDPRERKGKEFVNNEFIGKIAINVSDIPTQVPLDSPLDPEWYKLEDKDMDKANLSVGELMLVIWFGTQADEVFIDAWHSYVATVTGLVYLSPRLWYLRVNIIEAQDLVVPGDKNRNSEVYVKGTLGNIKTMRKLAISLGRCMIHLSEVYISGDVVQELKFASKLNVRISLDAAITERHLTGCGHQHLVCWSWGFQELDVKLLTLIVWPNTDLNGYRPELQSDSFSPKYNEQYTWKSMIRIRYLLSEFSIIVTSTERKVQVQKNLVLGS
ncbi:hypothetical protein CXB51_019762 [Gossypium anomalum]|uniref:tRNA/rRNA methyltransferase SpoU type domain-containing protein n=1 Tax=Gossypium anomalum TaxID=47600 RepID=A0A8J5YWR1_9ROSI|nr:hypothetical protein CXB51_019762 [Gossypium anomalum]